MVKKSKKNPHKTVFVSRVKFKESKVRGFEKNLVRFTVVVSVDLIVSGFPPAFSLFIC